MLIPASREYNYLQSEYCAFAICFMIGTVGLQCNTNRDKTNICRTCQVALVCFAHHSAVGTF